MTLAIDPTATARDPRWQAVLHRDATADGHFVFAVKTTGIYCRPSCPARRAKPGNVAFYASGAEAEAAGYRACRRCHPDAASRGERNAAAIAKACRLIETADEPPTLDALAAAAGMRRIRNELARDNRTVTEAIYEAGFNSSSRFYETANDLLGMTPSAYKHGGVNAAIRFAIGQCSLGAILVASSDKGVCAILLGDDPDRLARDLQDRFPKAELIGGDAQFEQLVARVVGFVDAPRIGLDLPLDMRGTAFQQRVWQALRDIPAGRTASYAEIARRIGAPTSARPVARACAANAIAVAIPCHRVVRTDGALSGYRWGVERKRALLLREARS